MGAEPGLTRYVNETTVRLELEAVESIIQMMWNVGSFSPFVTRGD